MGSLKKTMTDLHDSPALSRSSGRAAQLIFDDLPGENPLAHQGAIWWKMAVSRMIGAGVYVVAQGGVHPNCATIVDIPLDEFPELPVEHKDYERRRGERIKINMQNTANQAKRLKIQLEAWDLIYSAADECTAKNAPMLNETLRERCLLTSAHDSSENTDDSAFGVPVLAFSGHFDGPLAARALHHVCSGTARTDHDKDFIVTR